MNTMAIIRYNFSSLLVIMVALMFGSVTAQGCPIVYQLNAVPTNVNLTATSLPIVIRSPNYPSLYPNSISYTLNIGAGNQNLVLSFYFRDFDVEYSPLCNYDALYLQDIKYCGVWEANHVIPHPLRAHGSFTVNFQTDSSVANRGFEIIVIPELAKVEGEYPDDMFK